MTRLARDRDTHLEPEEIAEVTLRLFDAGEDPSIRRLASELKVTPSAIYHHFDSRHDVIEAAVDLVWREIFAASVERIGDPFSADPIDALVITGVMTRRGFERHYRIAPYMTAAPRSDEVYGIGVAMFANLIERLGLRGEAAAAAFHAYASFTFGTAVFAANRRIAAADFGGHGRDMSSLENLEPAVASLSSDETRAAIDRIVDLSEMDSERDEELFEQGLRLLLEGLRDGRGRL